MASYYLLRFIYNPGDVQSAAGISFSQRDFQQISAGSALSLVHVRYVFE
jgi:hypothetical protein